MRHLVSIGVCVAIVLALPGLLSGDEKAQEEGLPLPKGYSIYLLSSRPAMPAKITQWDGKGKLVGKWDHEHSITSITFDNQGLVASISAIWPPTGVKAPTKPGYLLRITPKGATQKLQLPDGFDRPSQVRAMPSLAHQFIADNYSDRVVFLPNGDAAKARDLITWPDSVDVKSGQSMSLALQENGSILFSSSEPGAIYRLNVNSTTKAEGAEHASPGVVAAVPGTANYVVYEKEREQFVVRSKDKELAVIKSPFGKQVYAGMVGINADLVLVTCPLPKSKVGIAAISLTEKKISTAFQTDESNPRDLVIGPRMEWK